MYEATSPEPADANLRTAESSPDLSVDKDDFAPFPAELERQRLEAAGASLTPPSSIDELAIEEYKKSFLDIFGYPPTPVPTENYELRMTSDTIGDQPPLWALNLDGNTSVITTNPAASALLAELGPAGLDIARPGAGEEDFSFYSAISLNNSKLYNSALGLRMITVTEHGIVSSRSDTAPKDSYVTFSSTKSFNPERQTDNDASDSEQASSLLTENYYTTLVDLTSRIENEVAAMLSIMAPNSNLRQAYLNYMADTGFSISVGKDGNTTVEQPTPRTYLERLETRRAKGKYSPPYTMVAQTMEQNEPVALEVFEFIVAEEGVPLSVDNSAVFAHDLLSGHTLSYLKFGDPLVNMLSVFAELGEDPDMMSVAHYDSALELQNDDPAIELLERDANIIDTFTNAIALSTRYGLGEVNELDDRLAYVTQRIADRLNEYGTENLTDMDVVKTAIENGWLNPGDDISVEAIIKSLLETAVIPNDTPKKQQSTRRLPC
jgi:hypothetical protein